MKITIKHKKSRFQKDLSKITVLQDDLTVSLNGSYYVVDGKYYYYDTYGQVSLVASNPAEFKQYFIEVLCKKPSIVSRLLSYFKSKLIQE